MDKGRALIFNRGTDYQWTRAGLIINGQGQGSKNAPGYLLEWPGVRLSISKHQTCGYVYSLALREGRSIEGSGESGALRAQGRAEH